ncbi:MAG: sporulation protein YqfD [Firmicutes bacterium]|nr:sporulation protein YqfD [Bacillota bacterium]
MKTENKAKTRYGTRILIEGFNQTRLLNTLRGEGVACSCIDKLSPAKIYITVAQKDCNKTFAILKKLCYTYTVTASVSPRSFGRYLIAKAALLACIALFTVLYAFSYRFIWRIEITGAEKVETAAIERLLAENGIKRGTAKSGINFTALRSLVNAQDDVLETSVSFSGVTLKIEVTETIDAYTPPPPAVNGIFSRCDAVVTRINAESGTPLVQPGSRVFSGAKLIGAYRISAQDQTEIPVGAVGTVYGTVTFTDSFAFSLNQTVHVRTGKKRRRTEYTLFGLKIGAKERHGFAAYETETREIYAFQNWFIPLKMRQTVYYQVSESRIKYDLAERTQYFTDTATANRSIQAIGGELTVQTKLEQISQDGYILHVFTQAEMLIAQN